jgi:hypothetical protein
MAVHRSSRRRPETAQEAAPQGAPTTTTNPAEGGRQAKQPPARLDWTNRADVTQVILDLRVALGDIDAIVRDMLRPLALRELGPVTHREQYDEAMGKALAIVAYVEPEPESGDPSGAGASPAD